jgi:hypothetical protein
MADMYTVFVRDVNPETMEPILTIEKVVAWFPVQHEDAFETGETFMRYEGFYNVPDIGLSSSESDSNWLTYTEAPGEPWIMELAQRYVNAGTLPKK